MQSPKILLGNVVPWELQDHSLYIAARSRANGAKMGRIAPGLAD